MYDNKKTLKDINLDNKRVIVRFDFNVPIKNGNVTTKKLQKLLPNNKVIFEPSLDFEVIKQKVDELQSGQILLLENTRYYDVDENNNVIKMESKNNSKLAKFWASLGDCFVNDAFGTVHRAHASNVGIAQNIKDSCIGFLIEDEIKSISQAIENPEHPYVAILGGAKVSDKIKVIDNLLSKVDKIIICGGMAYTFLGAQGYDIGKSICEPEMYNFAKQMLEKANGKIVLTKDAYCAKDFADTPGVLMNIQDGLKDMQALDIGDQTIELFNEVLNNAKTVVWNGPCGVFEFKNYQNGTKCIANTLAKLTNNGCYTLIGGGDSAAAIVQLGFKDSDYSFVSTGGGASLALIEGSQLPGIEAIKDR